MHRDQAAHRHKVFAEREPGRWGGPRRRLKPRRSWWRRRRLPRRRDTGEGRFAAGGGAARRGHGDLTVADLAPGTLDRARAEPGADADRSGGGSRPTSAVTTSAGTTAPTVTSWSRPRSGPRTWRRWGAHRDHRMQRLARLSPWRRGDRGDARRWLPASRLAPPPPSHSEGREAVRLRAPVPSGVTRSPAR